MTAFRPLIVTLGLCVVAVAYIASPTLPSRPAAARPTGERAVPAPPRAPQYTARDLLTTPLALAPAQRTRLESLAAAWQKESGPLDAEVAAAGAELETFMAEAAERRGARLADLQARSATFREASVRLRERRAVHQAAALAVLTPEQRAALTRTPLTAGGS